MKTANNTPTHAMPFAAGRRIGGRPAERKCRGGGYVNEAMCRFRQQRWPLSCGGCAWKGFPVAASTQSVFIHDAEVPR